MNKKFYNSLKLDLFGFLCLLKNYFFENIKIEFRYFYAIRYLDSRRYASTDAKEMKLKGYKLIKKDVV
jgi:hypothetical protein